MQIGEFAEPLASQHQLDELPMMVHGVFNGTVTEQYDATQRFRKLLSIGKQGSAFPAREGLVC